MNTELTRALLVIAIGVGGWAAALLLRLLTEVTKLRLTLTGEDGKNGLKGAHRDLVDRVDSIAAEAARLPALADRLEGICERVDAIAGDAARVPVLADRVGALSARVDEHWLKTGEIGKRVHQFGSWFTVVGHKLGIEFKRDL